jgi:hypothetical protein
MPLRNYSPESLTIQKKPDFFSFLPEVPPPFETVIVVVNRAARLTGGEGGPAKDGVSSGKYLAVTSWYGSSTVMAGTGWATCAGGRARRRRVLRPAHGGRVQSKGTRSFTGS